MERVTRPETGAEIAGFLQRIFAAWIDSFLLGLVFVFGVVGWLGWLSPEALLVQTGISFAYFSVFNSGLGGGGTIGKRIAGVRVISRSGDTISFARAMWRSGFDMLPSFAASYLPLVLRDPQFPIVAIGTAISGAFVLTNVYLYCFNIRTRQVLHDLVAGTFVVKADTCDRAVSEHILWAHVAAAIVFVALSAGVGTKVRQFQDAVQGRPLCQASISASVQTLPFVRRAIVDRNPWSPTAGLNAEQRIVFAYVRDGELAVQARAVARKTLEACPAMLDDHKLTVMMIPPYNGYSLVPQARFFPATVKQWRQSFAFERLATHNEGRCDIPAAVKTLPFAGLTTVSDRFSANGDETLHEKRVDVRLSDREVNASSALKDVARKAIAACPGMGDDTYLHVELIRGAGLPNDPAIDTVGGWRSALDYPARIARENSTCDFRRAVRSLAFVPHASFSRSEESKSGHLIRRENIEISVADGDVEPRDAAREVARKVLTTCPQLDDTTVVSITITRQGDAEPHVFHGTAGAWHGSLLARPASARDFSAPAPNGQ